MSKYLFLFRNDPDNLTDAQAQPEAWQEHMMKWKAWMGGLAEQGKLLGGEPLNKEGKVVKGKAKSVIDGPFVEGKEVVGGYLLVNAGNLDEAVEISKGCPTYEENGAVEVREITEMNM